MKKIILMLLIVTSVFAQDFVTREIGTIVSPGIQSNVELYEVCIKGRLYYYPRYGYRTGLAPVWEEIDHPVLGKIDQPKKCQ